MKKCSLTKKAKRKIIYDMSQNMEWNVSFAALVINQSIGQMEILQKVHKSVHIKYIKGRRQSDIWFHIFTYFL